MRVLAQIPHPEFQITLFVWNEKYLLKFELGLLEQTYKFPQMTVSAPDDVAAFAREEAFLEKVAQRFEAMQEDWRLLVEGF
ncbi:MAG: hypothetical protein HC913_08985 [Microscillaceae bacterium]|nr:hypothetical protein [Microscillaceae bacterium]